MRQISQILIILSSIFVLNCKNDGPRIISGIPCANLNHSVNYMVSITTHKKYHFCGGALLTSQFVLTAAHCCVHHKHILIGVLKEQIGTTYIPITKQYIHPDYFRSRRNNDVALLKMIFKVPEYLPATYARLPSREISIPIQDYCDTVLLLGWGYVDNNETHSEYLMCVHLPVVDVSECGIAYEMEKDVYNNYLCTFSNKGKDGCQGDSGGPLICTKTHEVLGVHSFGRDCGDGITPAVSMRVDKYLDFFNDIIRSNDSVDKHKIRLSVCLLYCFVNFYAIT